MNIYYIRKEELLGGAKLSLCVRVDNVECDKNVFLMSGLTFLGSEGFEISEDRKKWRFRSEYYNGKFFDIMEGRGNYFYEFETDEDALLLYELMEYKDE